MTLYIVIAVAVLILAAVLAYYIARFMKGSLKLDLSRNAASYGETVAGRITLEAKRPINGLLKVSLVGREKRRTKRVGGAEDDSTEWVEVFREDNILEETRQFEPGFTKTYQFEILAPTAAEARTGGAALRQIADQMGEGMAGNLTRMAAGAADFMRGRIYWHIESRLDADGVDLFTKQRCQINLRD